MSCALQLLPLPTVVCSLRLKGGRCRPRQSRTCVDQKRVLTYHVDVCTSNAHHIGVQAYDIVVVFSKCAQQIVLFFSIFQLAGKVLKPYWVHAYNLR